MAADEALAHTRARLDTEVRAAHSTGLSWTAIRAVLGISRQAARQRFCSRARTSANKTFRQSNARRDEDRRLQPTEVFARPRAAVSSPSIPRKSRASRENPASAACRLVSARVATYALTR